MNTYKLNKEQYIKTNEQVEKNDLETINQIVSCFPNVNNRLWVEQFEKFNPQPFDNRLLSLAANVYDCYKNPALNVASEAGNSRAIQRLIDWGAGLYKIDCNEKTAICWAMQEGNVKVLECLLVNGVDLSFHCKSSQNSIQYATKFEKHCLPMLEKYTKIQVAYTHGAVKGLFSERNLLVDSAEICESFLSFTDAKNLAKTCKNIYKKSSDELRTQGFFAEIKPKSSFREEMELPSKSAIL